MAAKYDHKKIEKKWQKYWDESQLFAAENKSKKPKYYCLVEFPYPSGDGLHVGHPRSYTALDILARKRRMEGFNVLYPMGFDAFGLPSENYAIKTGVHPSITTAKNIATFTQQMKALGFSFDWNRVVTTTDPEYYKWTQWIFLKMFDAGLAYKAKIAINWCPKDKIGLANEEVVNGCCERCGTPVEKKEKEQWMLAITKYADRLISDLETVDYLDRIKTSQINWIGRSEGINFKEKVKDLDIEFEVYDSIPQTFLAQTFTVIAPEHPLVEKLIAGTEYEKPVREFVEKIKEKKANNKFEIEKESEGIFTGRYVANPFGTGDLPIWIASYVLADYGTGIVNCSAHDERDFAFAKKYGIPLKIALLPSDPTQAERVKNLEEFYRAPEGILQEPAEYKGMTWTEARGPIIEYIEKNNLGRKAINYKLRDWVFSRQRYWGEPIPMIYCEQCEKNGTAKDGWVKVPENELPLVLPPVEKYEPTDDGQSPLSVITDWVNTTCPNCGGPAKRETDTMPNWAGSNWYFLRYLDPHNDKEFADKKAMEYWMPVDWYNGGMEHTTLHVLYSRFVYKFLYDIGAVPKVCGPEPYAKRTAHGLILGEGGEKMSKSKGNVVNPNEVVDQYGADTLRVYEMFMGPFDQAIPWDTQGVSGVRRFLDRVWNLYSGKMKTASEENVSVKALLHKTIKKVGEDIETQSYNTAVSSMMILINAIIESKTLDAETADTFLKLLSPFAPHIAEELWQLRGHEQSIQLEAWPAYDEKLLASQMITITVQVNGKVRATLSVVPGTTAEQVEGVARLQPTVAKYLDGVMVKNVIFVPDRLINFVL